MEFRSSFPVLLAASLLTPALVRAQQPDFVREVFPALQKAGCAGCHNPDGVASGTRLRFPEADASPAEVAAFRDSLHALVNVKSPADSPLVQKPTKRVAHAGGQRIKPGSPEEQLLLRFAEQLAQGPVPAVNTHAAAEKHAPAGPVLRRLTHAQYNNTVRDLLGDDSRIANSFPPEDFVNGFRNQYQSQNTSPLLAEAYASAAEKLAKKAISGDNAKKLIPCKPKGAADAACRTQFLKTFGQKAFRRPLTEQELQRYTRLFQAGAKTRFEDGAQIAVEAMLQSPNFLLRTENGLNAAWGPWETASRLSYFLWNTMPDEELFRSAAAGELNRPEGVEKAARRLIADARAKGAMNEFLTEWLRFDRLLGTVKDRRLYPQFTLELSVAMTEETKHLFMDLVWNNRNFMEFYSAPYTFPSAPLAALYGIKEPAEEYGRAELPASTERAGILGQATFLALTSKPAETSPTARGLFVREQFLCQEVPQPPPGVSTNLPALSKDQPQTTRGRLGIHLNSESCSSCHQLIDPIGFGFEKYDAIGGRREKQRVEFRPVRGEKMEITHVDLDLDTSGMVAGIPDSAFSSPRELGKILAGSTLCQECVVKQVFRYAAGRHETAADRVVIRKAYDTFKQSGFRFQEMLVSLSRWIAFPPGGKDGISTD